MNAPIPQREPLMHLDADAFVADPELVRALGERSTPVPCETERLLFHQDDPSDGVYILHEGGVTVSMESPTGKNIFKIEALPGSLLGLPGLISNQPYSLTAIAHAGAQVSFLSRADFAGIIQNEPQTFFKILQVLAAEVRSARRAFN